ncbi:DUF2786 domain-containing protein (plasmid) [Bartonella apihabitans]|nr:DUF2786 domain-containing protein [Bartonella apihabitans]WLT07753.1 DUF2786 domain-containing protein [Bartonella apihabitans]
MDNEAIKKRIRALLNKTVKNGCTEAEAMIAAQKVAELLAKYSLSASATDITHREFTGNMAKTNRLFLRNCIARVTNTYILRSDDDMLNVYGVEPAPEIAEYLLDVCERTIEREINAFQKSTLYRRKRTIYSRRQATSDFIAGLVLRIQDKIEELFADNIDRSLRDRVKTTVKENPPFEICHTTHKRPKVKAFDAFEAGDEAADNIHINFGVNGRGRLALEVKSNEK